MGHSCMQRDCNILIYLKRSNCSCLLSSFNTHNPALAKHTSLILLRATLNAVPAPLLCQVLLVTVNGNPADYHTIHPTLPLENGPAKADMYSTPQYKWEPSNDMSGSELPGNCPLSFIFLHILCLHSLPLAFIFILVRSLVY